MFYHERKKLPKNVFYVLAVSVIVFLSACASNMASRQETNEEKMINAEPEPKLVTDIGVNDTQQTVIVSIEGNQLLTYTAVKQPLPLGLVLYFPETSLGIAKKEYQVEGDVIASIKAAELIENGPSKITIALKTDAPYKIDRSGNGLKITFGQIEEERPEVAEQFEIAEEEEPVEAAQIAEEKADMAVEENLEEGEELPADSLPVVEATPMPVASAPLVATVPVEETAAVSDTVLDAALQPSAASGENMFREISAIRADDGVSVLIRSDQMIKDYNIFTLSGPPRIVVDLKDVKSGHKKQQTVSVNSKWVKTVRHFAYPEKLRVVLDTEKEHLAAYSAEPAENGLLIIVADSIETVVPVSETASSAPEEIPVESAPVEEDPVMEKAPFEEEVVPIASAAPLVATAIEPEVGAESVTVTPESVPLKAALVNRIDFLSGDAGKSSIIIGTTRPIDYNLDKSNDNKLALDLFETKILSYRQRPLITTRFESAVNRIIPIQTPGMNNTSKIIIELREAVPFAVKQTDNEIHLNFEASSIAPKSLEAAGLPPWEKVMAEAALEAEAEVAKAEQAVAEAPSEMPVATAPETESAGQVDTEEMATSEIEGPPEAEVAEPEGELDVKPDEEMPETTETAMDVAKADEELLPELAEEETKPAEKRKTASRYTGEKIALDFYQTDIKNVLRILRDVSGKNFAIDKDVSGNVTLTLVKPIPWDQVLDLILKMNQLGKISEGDIVRIVTISTLRKEEKTRADELKAEQSIKEQQKALEPLVTEYIPINYADANSDIKPRLDQIATPKRGKVGVDSRNNQIIMTDTAEKIAQAKEIIKSIDKVTPQVVIEARIVEVSENFSRDIGTTWGLTDGPVINGSDSQTYTIAMNHPPSSSSGTIGYQFARLAGTNVSLNAELQAVEAAGEGKIISTPKIVTLDNKEATISQGIEYPYLERDSSGLSTTKFKSIDLELKVKPHVTPDNRINLNINIKKDDIGTITGGVPSLNTNEAKTELLVNDGDTIVIGGILKTNANETQTRFPLLSKIPIVGWLFKSKTNSNTKNELLIFITPRIVHLETHT